MVWVPSTPLPIWVATKRRSISKAKSTSYHRESGEISESIEHLLEGPLALSGLVRQTRTNGCSDVRGHDIASR
jgi:hypothetical protein